jgi:hypothetical protein
MMSAVRSAERLLSAKAWKGFVVGRYPDEFASARSDKQLEAYVRNNTVSILHPIGTASMSPYGASWGVVDPGEKCLQGIIHLAYIVMKDLKVKRVSGLRIVDGSVIRKYSSANVYLLILTDSHTSSLCSFGSSDGNYLRLCRTSKPCDQRCA